MDQGFTTLQLVEGTEDVEELIQALDSRGVREGGLLPALLRAQPELAAAQPAGPILCALLLLYTHNLQASTS